ncbi:MAG: SprT-like domain-containing protein [Flavobacteriales bacterium]|nr:SprT-like domain-containing protein [Flavobacteriales bacterium]
MLLEQAKELALELMKQHGLNHWHFKFDYAKRRFGCCNESTKTISLSKHLTSINEVSVVKNVILHEIAHALVGAKHRHNSIWKQKAREINCEYTSCYVPKDINSVEGNIVAECPKCGFIHRKYRMPKRITSCGKCSNKFDKERILNFVRLQNTDS